MGVGHTNILVINKYSQSNLQITLELSQNPEKYVTEETQQVIIIRIIKCNNINYNVCSFC